MSANRGLLLVDAILRTGRLKPVLDAGITPDMLTGPARLALEFILDYASQPSTQGMVPMRDMVPVTDWPKLSDKRPTLEHLCEMVKRDHLAEVGRAIIDEMQEMLDDDPLEAISTAKQHLMEVDSSIIERTTDVDASSVLVSCMYEYIDTLQSGGGMTGLPFPWDILTEDTLGMQEGDLIVIYGMPKQMKTWVALAIIAHVYRVTDVKGLIFSPEVNQRKMLLRLASLLAGVDYTKVKTGFRASPNEFEPFMDTLYQLQRCARQAGEGGQRLMLVSGTITAAQKRSPLDVLRDKIETYEPKIIMLDSAYYLSSDLDWKAVSSFTRDAKKLAEEMRCVVIMTSQENQREAVKAAHAGKSPGASSIAYSQSFINDCDLALRCVKKLVHGPRRGQLVSLEVAAARDSQVEGFTIKGNPGHDMGFHNDKIIPLGEALASQQKGGASKDGKPPSRPVDTKKNRDRTRKRLDDWQRGKDEEDD